MFRDQTIYPVNGKKLWREGREGSEGQSHKGGERKIGSGIGEGPKLRRKGFKLGFLCEGPRVPSYATVDGVGLPT